MDSLENKVWWGYLEEDLQELLKESILLLEKTSVWKEDFHDYAFVVFPAAKAYEGFLKKLFLDLGFISESEYFGKRFRIGKALNPSLEPKVREKESVYDRIVAFCKGPDLADKLWNTWKSSRNLVFHWFPNEENAINHRGAKERINKIIDAIDEAFKECRLNSK